MSDLIVPNIICFQTQKQLATLNNVGVLVKSVLIDLRARNFVHAKISLRARFVHARHRGRNLSSPDTIFMNSENSKTSKPHVLILNLTDKTDLRKGEKAIALSNLSIYYTWKNIKKIK